VGFKEMLHYLNQKKPEKKTGGVPARATLQPGTHSNASVNAL